MNKVFKNCGTLAAICLLANASACLAWSNRGHRTVNLVAAETLPATMPAFMRTPKAIHEISYLGPEPDRWGAGGREPELIRATGLDHFFLVQMGQQLGPLPRYRYVYYSEVYKRGWSPTKTGTLPWAAQEVFQRLVTAFHSYRILHGEIPKGTYEDMEPMTNADLPDIEASAIFYAGWLGHYVGDGSQPLHDTVNISGWIQKSNPHGYTTNHIIHHRFELVADNAIGDGSITPEAIRAFEKPARILNDPFVDVLSYLKMEGGHSEAVYQFEKAGAMQDSGTPALRKFIEERMAEGSGMLRDLIYTAWVDSSRVSAPERDPTTNILNR